MKKILIKFPNKKQTMRRKLFFHMALLSVMLLIILTLSLFAIGSITSTSTKLSNILLLQLEVFNRDVSSYYENISFQCTKLSEKLSKNTDEYLKTGDITFKDLENSNENIKKLENYYMKTLKEYLSKSSCSGVFIILDTSRGKQDDNSKACVYIKRNMFGYDVKDKLLLYRGNVEEAKELNILIHRKWSLEFDTKLYPEFKESLLKKVNPLENSCCIDGIIDLPGTSEQVMIISIPIRDKDGKNYGICGFEIGSDVFKSTHMQPTTLKHLVCLLSKNNNEKTIDANEGFSCGNTNGYYKPPKGSLTIKEFSKKNKLISLTNKHNSYVGITKNITIYNEDSKYNITAMIPKSDYMQKHIVYLMKIILLILIIGILLISSSLYFSSRYIIPIIKELDKIKGTEPLNTDSNILEIDDLFEFLSKKDSKYESSIKMLLKDKKIAEQEIEKIQKELEKLLNESKKNVDPDEYNYFKQNIKLLTKSEKIIFDMYIDGKNSNEITSQLNIKISTLKFHNHNIYQKLGVKSRKQLIKLAMLLENEKIK